MVVSISTVNAQKLSQETINKAIDKLNCLATENSVTESKMAWKCDCNSSPNYDIIKNSIPADLSNTLALSSEINQIKKQSVPSATKNDLIKFLTEDVFTKKSQYAKLYSFALARSNREEFVDWKKKLETHISEVVSKSTLKQKQLDNDDIDQSSPQKEPVVEHEMNTIENESESIESKSFAFIDKGIFAFEIDVVAIMLMIILVIVIVKLSNGSFADAPIRSKRDIPEHIRSYVKEKIESANFVNRGSVNSVHSSNEISRLKEEIFHLNKEIELLSQYVHAEKYKNQEEIKKDHKIINEAIYLSNPNNEGGFNDSSSSTSYKEGASIYRFVKSSSNEASFQIDERESSIKMAMQFPEKNILPVCDSENEYEPRFTKVRTIEPGKVSLEGGKWKVKRKAKIRYES